MDKKLAMVRMYELSIAFNTIADAIIESDETDEYFKHMLSRATAVLGRISDCTRPVDAEGGRKEFTWSEGSALKLWMREMSEEADRFKDTKIIPQRSWIVVRDEIASILTGMKDIEPVDEDTV